MSNQNVETVEHEYWVELAQALDRLENNEDFKKVILNGYFKDKAVDGVSLLSTEYVRRNSLRGSIIEDLAAISALSEFFKYIKNLGAVDDGPIDDEEDKD